MLLAAVVLPPALAAAPASAAKPVVTTYVAMSGVPSHVDAGGTLAFTLTFRQESTLRLYMDGLSFEIWNRCMCPPDDPDGTVATFLDPSTGTWRKSTVSSGNAYSLYPSEPLLVSPGQKVSIPVRLPVAKFRSGSYALADNGTVVGNAVDAQGGFVEYTWKWNEAPDRYLTIGKAATQPSTKPKPAATSAPRKAAAPSPKPSAALPIPSASASPSIESSTAEVSASDSAPPAVVPASASPTDSPMPSPWWLALLLLPALGAGGWARHRRARPPRLEPVDEGS